MMKDVKHSALKSFLEHPGTLPALFLIGYFAVQIWILPAMGVET